MLPAAAFFGGVLEEAVLASRTQGVAAAAAANHGGVLAGTATAVTAIGAI